MIDSCKSHAELTQEFHLIPDPATAISEWCIVRQRFQTQRCSERQDAYMKATDELSQAISQWQFLNPALAEQFGIWFQSHAEDWAL